VAITTLGVIGGIVRLYFTVTLFMGRIIMTILKCLKKREHRRARRRKINDLNTVQDVEMGNVSNAPNMSSDDRRVLVFSPIKKSRSCHNFGSMCLHDEVVLKDRALMQLPT